MVTPLLLLFLSSVLPGGFYSLILFFSSTFLEIFFWLALFSAAQTHNTSTTVTSAPPTARGQFSKDWQLINMVLTRRWDGARELPTFISFSYDLEVHPCRVTSRRERIVRSVWGRRSSRFQIFFFSDKLTSLLFFPRKSLNVTCKAKGTMRSQKMHNRAASNARSVLSVLKEEK